MSYLETMRAESETKFRPLAAKVAKARKNLARIEHSATVESDRATRTAEEIETLKRCASESLTGNPNDYEKFKVNIRKLMAKVATSKEVVALLHREIIPNMKRDLAVAQQGLAREFTGLYVEALPGCEAEMARLLGQIVAEYDGFILAFEQLGKENGLFFNMEPPHAVHRRILGTDAFGGAEHLRWITFTPARATMPAAAVLTLPERVESPPTGAREGSVKGDTPPPPDNAQEGLAAAPGETTPVEPPQEAAPDPDPDPNEDPDPPDLDEAAAAKAAAEAPSE